MTQWEAALVVLHDDPSRMLHYRDITEQIITARLCTFEAENPAQSVRVAMADRCPHEGLFRLMGDGMYTIGDAAKAESLLREIGIRSPELRRVADAFEEGGVRFKLHRRKERNRRAVQRKKEVVLAKHGRLCCEACDFDFAQVYGSLGAEFAECHHRIPLADLEGKHRTRLSELAIVCANCHRMLHRSRPMLSVGELREIVLRFRRSG